MQHGAMRKKLVIVGLAAVVFLAADILLFYNAVSKPHVSYESRLKVGNNIFDVEMASTATARALGLSGRDILGENEGMFFIFDEPGDYGFWMKDMKFPIDIIWIRSGSPSQISPGEIWEGKVVGFAENAVPEPGKPVWNLKIYYPPEPIDRVLEINGGVVSKNKIKVGDSVTERY